MLALVTSHLAQFMIGLEFHPRPVEAFKRAVLLLPPGFTQSAVFTRPAVPFWHSRAVVLVDVVRYDQRAEALGKKGMIQTDNM